MSTIELSAHISADGRVTIPSIPDWTGGETDAKVVVKLSETEGSFKTSGRKFYETWNGLIEGTQDITAEIRAERMEKKYGAGQPFDDDWRPDPAAVRQFFESRKSLAVELTDEEIEKLKHERRMGKMQ